MATKYTDEMVKYISDTYTALRSVGGLNRDILEGLVDGVAMEFEVEVNPASLRAKLNGIPTADGFVYRKDTEDEKVILAARTGKTPKVKGPTKYDRAEWILNALGIENVAGDIATDLAKAKVTTLKALEAAVLAVVKE